MKKMITLVVFLLTLVSGAFAAAWTGSNTEPENMTKIDGKAFYVITSAEELAWFAAQVNAGKTTINAVLQTSITLGTTYTWTPIGKDSSHVYQGVFDGAGYTITSPYTTSGNFAGLFGVTGSNSIVKNFTISSPSITHSRYGGAVVGFNNGTISDISVLKGTVQSLNSKTFTGGLVGKNKGKIINCIGSVYLKSNSGTKDTKHLGYKGGIAGYNVSGGEIENVTNNGQNEHYEENGVEGDTIGFWFGGVVGYNEGSLKKAVNNGFVSDTSRSSMSNEAARFLGGIVGYNTGLVESSKNNAKVYRFEVDGFGHNLYIGGIAAYNSGTISASENAANINCDAKVLRGVNYDSTFFYGGGIAGYNTGSVSNTINQGNVCYTGAFRGIGSQKPDIKVGGIVGFNSGSSAKISNSYSAASSIAFTALMSGYTVNGGNLGGVAGGNGNSALITNSYYDQTILSSVSSPVGLQSAKITNASGKTTTDMKKDQFAWILNTTNGTATNSKIWSRTDGYPIFATSTYKPIVRVVFDDDGVTTNKYGTNKGTVAFPSTPTPATGYIFDGWYNGSTKVTSSTVFNADATVIAKYLNTATLTYTIKFYNDDKKTLLNTQSVGYGKTPVYSGATPTKAATAQYSYTFSKWDRTLAAAYQDTSYYAVYTATVNSYGIVFKDYDGTQLQSSAVNYGVTPTCSKTPTRASTAEWKYTFKGWTPTVTSVTKAATYTAVYDSSKVQYAITFNNYDGTKLSTVNVNYGAIPSYSGNPTHAGNAQWSYTFKTWSPSLEAVTKAATYTAVYDSVTAEYDVTFKDYDGKVLQTAKLEYGTMPTAPTAPSRTATAEWSYTFAGWDKELATVSSSVEYKAVYDSIKNSYEVTFVDFDNSELQKTTLEYGKTPTCTKIPTRESSAEWNYDFKGWNPAIASVTGKTTYKAVYDSSKVKYVVSLMNEGSAVQTENVAYGETFTVPRGVAKDGYTFVGWYVGEDLLGNVGDVIIVSQNIVAEAKYSINSYVVKFLDFDGVVLKKDSYEYGSIPVYGSAVSREATAEWNYEFIGWTPAIGKVIKATNYTAMYDSTKVKYEVVFMNGNAEIDAQEVEYGSAAEKPADPKKAGYTFVGWNKDFSNVTENLVVEALFEENVASSSSKEPESSSSAENPNSSSSSSSENTASSSSKGPESSSSAENPNSSSSSSSEKVENSSSSEESSTVIGASLNPQFRAMVNARNVQIAGAHIGSAFAVMDMQGRVLKQGRVDAANFNIPVPGAGNYLIRIGSQTKRVVVR